MTIAEGVTLAFVAEEHVSAGQVGRREATHLHSPAGFRFGDFRRAGGGGWITLTDPEGNEFCVLAPDQATSNPFS